MSSEILLLFDPSGMGRVVSGGPITAVSGQTIKGIVNMDAALAEVEGIDHVKIALAGTVETSIRGTDDSVSLLRKELVLWRNGISPQSPRSTLTRLPFSFRIPKTLPPSFDTDPDYETMRDTRGAVRYVLEVSGVMPREGWLKCVRRGYANIKLTSLVSPEPLGVTDSIPLAAGARVSHRVHECVRPHWWARPCRAELELALPYRLTYPTGTLVPLQLLVETTTRPMKTSLIPKAISRLLFPAPPSEAISIDLWIERQSFLNAKNRTHTVSDRLDPLQLPPLGPETPLELQRSEKASQLVVEDPIWTRSKSKWTCECTVRLETSAIFPCVPSFETLNF
ncbi:hypothetical protein PUNSTDRAFT_127729 [Punctularia strigosozonata HHB-11173 SS5]|uniref:uncharacterized protein n=1 Tax=Punctularia strigosozonata (strain HHB-11173) TaxID=741275 RepID=UPI0004417419|nr:uncharacterized protein PUNSTDRAFT_127729 [Punctularia strigosozonata HHB-11173 SS5]EIN05777.1 hypothetical protein PUNSTDRAFT_127729 [Punctularia strigosozonata HHB-11173 SS5]